MDSTARTLPTLNSPDVLTGPPQLKRILAWLDHPHAIRVGMVVVLLVAVLFRGYSLDWDSGRHLHPDERFLSTVTNDLQWPTDWSDYFNPATSTLSPYALPNMGLYIYGTLPVYVVKWTAIQFNNNNYDQITQMGRALSVLFDLGAIGFLFLIGRRLYGKKAGLLAAGLLSLSVLNIQLSHFYAVDTFANLFIVATIFFLLRASAHGGWTDYALTGLMFGLGLASKLSAITLAAPILVGAGLDFYRRSRQDDIRLAVEQSAVRLLTVFVVAALTFRLFQPIAFNGPSFWDWSLNPRWLRDFNDQQNIVGGSVDLPWVQQWTDRSVLFPLYNMVVWGLGLPLGLASLAGFGLATFELVGRRNLMHLIPWVYVAVTFLYHATTFVKFMRYFLPVYPFLALFAAYLVAWLWRRARTADEHLAEARASSPGPRVFAWTRLTPNLALGVSAFVLGGTLLYAFAFGAIYMRPNPRIAATQWMYQEIPPGSTLANEHWDDWLPIGGVEGKIAYGPTGLFKSVEMANYEDDTPAKLDKMVDNLTQADYIVLSSNRLYDSIPRLPMRYPMTSRYYQLLFGGELGFERLAEFTSYSTLLGIQIPDQIAEESFSVYDHPRVQIFKKTAAFDAAKVRRALSDGMDWASVLRLIPREASAALSALLLSPRDRNLYEETARWSSAEVSEESWGSRVPVLAWFLVLEVIGLLALPLTLIAFKRLADRGYVLSKAIGLLIVAWGAWVIASARLAPFTALTIWGVMALLLLASLALLRREWTELRTFARTHWRLLLLEEGFFWILFGLFLLIRWSNPDLWHPSLGGEKPMDLAYLTAIVHTPYFPSYDPWFAGGYINYYYFGFVLIGTLVHLTGVVPTVAYNLAVPTLFALTGMGAFAVSFNLVEGRDRACQERHWLGVARASLLAGVGGALFVAVLGNLGQAQLIWDGVRNLSTIKVEGTPSPIVALAQFADGWQWLSTRTLEIRTNWWYWNATRVIPPGNGEAGPINEMPYFTFLFGDLHAHMMALPYTLLALAFGLNVVRDLNGGTLSEGDPSWWRRPAEFLTLALLALTTGALWPMNTWDYPTYIVLAAVALACREFAQRGRLDPTAVGAVVGQVVLIALLGRIFFLPFFQNYASDYLGIELWNGSRTPLSAYWVIHGFFLFVLSAYLVVELGHGTRHNALVRSLRLTVRHWRRRKHQQRLWDLRVRPTPGYRLAANLLGGLAVLSVVTLLLNPVIGLALGLLLLTALLFLSPHADPRRQFILSLIGLGLLLTLLVEFVVLKGDISRMNTVFKFYLQVWVLWGIASASVVPFLASHLRMRFRFSPVAELPGGRPSTPEELGGMARRRARPASAWARVWWSAFGILLAASLLYPLTATPARIRDRFPNSLSTTLDGTAYLQTSVYQDEGRPIVLDWDRQAFAWLQRNVTGMPTIVEASTPLYRWGSRVSVYTGLPTVIGWDWHQKQQRSVLPGKVINQRLDDVRAIYTSVDASQTKQLLNQYHIQYIYVGPLERIYYSGPGLDKFDQSGHPWRLVYQNDQVKIYQVN